MDARSTLVNGAWVMCPFGQRAYYYLRQHQLQAGRDYIGLWEDTGTSTSPSYDLRSNIVSGSTRGLCKAVFWMVFACFNASQEKLHHSCTMHAAKALQ